MNDIKPSPRFSSGFSLRIFTFVLALLCLQLSFADAKPQLTLSQYQKRPKLVVVIVLDQFRADYLNRFSSRFLPAKTPRGDLGGFQYLMSQSAYFPAAKYDILQNMTCPGHSMILTGTYPYRSGIPINKWYDPKLGRLRYCVEDEKDGFSPRTIIGSTVGDELKNAGYPSQVIALALKDRSAIALGGHRSDLSFWLNEKGEWTTSTYYSADLALPAWLGDINKALAKTRGRTLTWTVSKPGTGFSKTNKGFSRTAVEGSTESLMMPFGVEITTDAALAALRGAKLGSGKATDLLAISYSTHDILGHNTGPNSQEMEEMTLAEDREIARLINGIKKAVPGGLTDVVFALTADHGVSPDAAYLSANKVIAGRIPSRQIMSDANAILNKTFGKPKVGTDWIVSEESFNFYLNQEALKANGVDRKAAEQEVKKAFLAVEGVSHVFTKTEYETGLLPAGEFERQIKKTYFPGRSGDVIIIPLPFFMETGPTTTHMTGYSYDRSAPLLIAGPDIQPGVYATTSDIVDLAPTLSFMVRTIAPAQSEGRILSEIFGK